MRNAGSNTKVEAVVILAVMLLLMPIMARAGNLEPSAPPTSGTMHSLEDIYQKLSEIDANMKILLGRQGIGLRFLDNKNGTVTDLRTGLIWLKNANANGIKNQMEAEDYCKALASGTAGLTDGSTAGQWRLPSRAELQGLGTDPPATWDYDYGTPSIPWTNPGAPFTNVQSVYWSATIQLGGPPPTSWTVNMVSGYTTSYVVTQYDFYVWPVRGSGWK